MYVYICIRILYMCICIYAYRCMCICVCMDLYVEAEMMTNITERRACTYIYIYIYKFSFIHLFVLQFVCFIMFIFEACAIIAIFGRWDHNIGSCGITCGRALVLSVLRLPNERARRRLYP